MTRQPEGSTWLQQRGVILVIHRVGLTHLQPMSSRGPPPAAKILCAQWSPARATQPRSR
jgi:hypothetical protein